MEFKGKLYAWKEERTSNRWDKRLPAVVFFYFFFFNVLFTYSVLIFGFEV